MTYIDEVIRLLRVELPNLSDDLANYYALLVLTTGGSTTLEHVHDAWSIRTNVTRPDHHSLVPFDALTLEVQELDRKYRDAIIVTAQRWRQSVLGV